MRPTRLKIDDPELDPIWEVCGKRNVPVLIHSGEPSEFFEAIDSSNERWLELSLFRDRRYPPESFRRFEEVMIEQENVFARHPETRFLAAHFAWRAADVRRAASLLDRLSNVYLEVAAVLTVRHGSSGGSAQEAVLQECPQGDARAPTKRSSAQSPEKANHAEN